MRKVKVLFFTADPRLARPGGQALELAEDLRQIMWRVRQARYGHRLVFEQHGAARADDLIDLLEHTDAQIIHFSGHGGNAGLVFVGRGGHRPQPVDAAALEQLFRMGHGAIRLAVLSACTSHAEAQAIADVVGCAIGTLNDISDDAAIRFNSRFYEAIANGDSVQRAYDRARTALQVNGVPESEYPQVFLRNGVDPAGVVLVKTYRPERKRAAVAAVACVVTAAVMAWPESVPQELTVSDIACGAVQRGGMAQAAVSATPVNAAGAAGKVADAKALYGGGKYDAAAVAFEEAAEAGNGAAMGCLGYMYLAGRGMDTQSATGIEWLRNGAREKRDPHSMYALANAYLAGLGVDRAPHLAEDWLEKAADKGYAEAMRGLGQLHQQRMNDSSYEQARALYERAMNSGSVDASVDLGGMYEFGQGVRRDSATAFRLYQSAANAGSPHGMFAVGRSYEKGVGVAHDYEQAMVWYRKAAEMGCADAMNSIGVLYDNGLGVRKSHAKARRWYKRAEKAGSTLAKGNLGTFGRN